MRLKPQLDSEADGYFVPVDFLKLFKFLAVGRDVQGKVKSIRGRWEIRIEMFGEADSAQMSVDGCADHLFHGSGRI